MAATQITFEALPALNEVFAGQADRRRVDVAAGRGLPRRLGRRARGGAGTPRRPGTSSSQTTFDIGQLTKELTAADVLSNDWVAAGNDFDHDAVKEAATGYELTEDFASLHAAGRRWRVTRVMSGTQGVRVTRSQVVSPDTLITLTPSPGE